MEVLQLPVKIIENGKVLIETERLIIREMVQSDYEALCRILCDEDVMRATYESAFSHEEAQSWLNRHLKRYAEYGFGLWAVVLKEANVMIGQCGLTIQGWREREVLEIGYLFQKAYWHKGYATEAAIACREYAFSVLNASSVYSIVRDTNIASQNVAVRNGMKIIDKDTKNFRSVDMEFFLYSVERASIAIDDVLDVKVVKPFRHETLEERAAEFNGKLNLDGEYDWGESV